MGRWVAAALLLLAPACKAELSDNLASSDASNSQPDDSGMNVLTDGGVDAPVMLGAWGVPTAIPGASSALGEDDCTLSSNKLELYFKRTDSGGDNNLYMMTRASTTAAWNAPAAIGVLNSTAQEESPRLSSNDLTLYFGRGGDIYRSTRTAVGQPWTAPTPVSTLNTGDYEKWADVCSDGYVIVSRDGAGNGQDLYAGTLAAGATQALTVFNTGAAEQGTLLSADCLHLYFQSNRDNDQFDLFEASRTSTTAAWSNPTKLSVFNTATSSEEDPWVSTDQRVFVFASNANGNKDLFISTR